MLKEELNRKKNHLIEFYKEFIYLEDLNNIKIDPSKNQLVSEPLFVNFSQLKENEQNGNFINLDIQQKNEINKKFPIQKDNSNKDVNKIYLFFPLIKVIEKNNRTSKEFLYPLFAIDITEYKEDLKNPDFDIPLELLSSSNYQPIFNTFNKFLGIEEDFFAENIALSYLLNNLMKTKFSSAKNILEYFLKYLNNQLKGGELFSKFALISKLEINQLSKNLKYELDAIKNSDILTMPLIEDYLFKKHNYNKKENKFIEDNRTIWRGSFGEYPLSKGQARVIQGLSKEDKIISVIGAPGTGKTTLFLSVIASQIVDRTISLIKKGEDKKNFIFITSTSNKAVSNVIEDFKSIFKDRKDFYFIGGKRDNIEESKNRILNFIEELEHNEIGFYDKEKQNNIKQQILNILDNMDYIQEIFLKKENLEYEQNNLNNKISSIKLLTEEISSIPEKEAEEKLLSKKINELIELEKELEKKKLLYKEKQETIDYIYKNLNNYFDFKESFLLEKDLNSILKGPFLKEVNNIGHKLISINPFLSVFEFLFKKKKQILDNFKKENETFVNGMNVIITENNIYKLADISERLIEYYEKELKDVDITSLKSTELIQQEIDINFKNKIKLNKEKQDLNNLIKGLKNKREESKITLNSIKDKQLEIKVMKKELNEYDYIFAEFNHFSSYYREKLVLENKKLYELSNQYLEQEVLRQKDKVIYYLRTWIDLLDDKKSKEEKKFIDFEEFYTTISLVYPVVTSTLASVSNNIKTDIYNKRKYKPFSLCLSDESGMISVQSLLPALFRAEKAIVVGDPKQLEPIVSLSDSNKDELMSFIDNREEFEKYSPTESTAYHRAAFCDTGSYSDIGNGILLDEHRRCVPMIANLFKEIAGYKGLDVRTNELSLYEQERLDKLNFKNLTFINVKGTYGKYDNTNISEINKIKELLKSLSEAGVDIKKEVGIITPFSNQETLLLENFSKDINHSYGNEKIGTVHKFQGAEFNYIIFSSVIFGIYNKASFINLKPNLLNVAISRAKQCFIHVGDEETLNQSGGYLGIMMKHYSIYGKKF